MLKAGKKMIDVKEVLMGYLRDFGVIREDRKFKRDNTTLFNRNDIPITSAGSGIGSGAGCSGHADVAE